jgi:hypothetical protein
MTVSGYEEKDSLRAWLRGAEENFKFAYDVNPRAPLISLPDKAALNHGAGVSDCLVPRYVFKKKSVIVFRKRRADAVWCFILKNDDKYSAEVGDCDLRGVGETRGNAQAIVLNSPRLEAVRVRAVKNVQLVIIYRA